MSTKQNEPSFENPMTLDDFAESHDICYKTAYNWAHSGKVQSMKKNGRVLVISDKPSTAVLYSRVCHQKDVGLLTEQIRNLRAYTAKEHLFIMKEVREVSLSALDEGSEFRKLLENDTICVIVVDKPDTIARCNVDLIQQLLEKVGRRLVFLSQQESPENFEEEFLHLSEKVAKRAGFKIARSQIESALTYKVG